MGDDGKRVGVLVKFPSGLLERVDGVAEAGGVTRTSLILSLVEAGLSDGEKAHIQLRPKPGGGSTAVERVSRVRGFSAMSGEPIMTMTGPAPAPVKAGVAKAAKGKAGVE